MRDPYLDISGSNGATRVSLADRTLWRIGRSKGNEVFISDDKASRAHALIQRLPGGQLLVIDCGSRNGSFVNDQRVNLPIAVRDGDVLMIGDTRMIFRLPGGAPARPGSTPSTKLSMSDLETRPNQRECVACILVIDVRDYTVLSRKMDNIAVAELVGLWCGEIGSIIAGLGSGVDKYFGDAAMAVWFDLPGAAEPAVLTAMRAAAAIAQCTAAINLNTNLPAPLTIGAGIHMGPAVVSTIGVRGRGDYTVLGDAVNMAFRIESATRKLGRDLAVSESAYATIAALAPLPPFEVHETDLKGYDERVMVRAGNFDALTAWLRHVS